MTSRTCATYSASFSSARFTSTFRQAQRTDQGFAMAYWGVGALFEKVGGASQLQPAVAAWSPDVMFALAGLYLLLRARS